MTRDERRAHLKTILDSYDAALAAYQAARWSHTLDRMYDVLKGMQALEYAQAEAITALRTANRAALALLNADDDDDDDGADASRGRKLGS